MSDITPKELRDLAQAMEDEDYRVCNIETAWKLRDAARHLERLERDLDELRHELSRVQTELENRE